MSAAPKAKKEVVIAKGKGKKLGEIDYVKAQLEKRKLADKALSALHRIVFGTLGRKMYVKKNLREFCGVVYDADFDRAKLDARLSAKPVNMLRDVAQLVGLERGGSKEEIAERIAKFLEKPHETDAKPERSSPKKKKSSSPSKKGSKRTKKSDKKAKGPKRPLSAYMFFVKDKRPEVAKKHSDEPVTEIAKRLGEMWHKLKDKSEYEAQALKDKKRYEKECK